MTEGIGHCKHGEFILNEGCQKCIEERLAEEAWANMGGRPDQGPAPPVSIVKVRYIKRETGEPEGREYSYFTEEPLGLDFHVKAPTQHGFVEAVVTALDVPEAEVAAFRDHVKTIPAGSIMVRPVPDGVLAELSTAAEAGETLEGVVKAVQEALPTCEEMAERLKPASLIEASEGEPVLVDGVPILDTKINLCDTCISRMDYPVCSPTSIVFGDGIGNDNVIKCSKHSVGPAAPCSVPLNVEINPGKHLAGAKMVDSKRAFNKWLNEPCLPPGGLAEAAQAAGAEVTEKMVAVRTNPGDDEKAVALYDQGVGLRDRAVARVIQSNDDLKPTTDDLALISKVKKALTALRKEYEDPIRADLDVVLTAFKEFMAPLLEADIANRAKMTAYDAEVRRKAVEAAQINRDKIELAQREAKLSGTGEFTVDTTPVEVASAPGPIRTEMGTASMVANWKYEVIDFSLLPDRFKMENATLIGKVVRAGEREIPGVKIWSEDTVRVTERW